MPLVTVMRTGVILALIVTAGCRTEPMTDDLMLITRDGCALRG
jgi:hypothetical protein